VSARRHKALSRTICAKLKQARIARLATVDANLEPHVVPVCFAYHGNSFYTALDQKPKRVTPERLRRVRNIAVNPEVALLIDEYTEDWAQLWYILIRGQAQLMPARKGKERGRAIRMLRAKYSQYSERMLPNDAPIIRITPTRTTCWGKI